MTDQLRQLRARAEEVDRTDPLGAYRQQFADTDNGLVYFDGNSLGRPPAAARARLLEVFDEEWSRRLIRSWTDSWVDLPTRLGDMIGTGLLGAKAGEVVVSDNTTVSLYKAIMAALDARPDRSTIVIERDNFPTDRYLVESISRQRSLTVRWIDERGAYGLTVDDVREALTDDVALVVLSHVDYRSASITDLRAITVAAHEVGALVLWDLCHSAGVIPVHLEEDAVDLAVGCTYKYLNGGPGSPAFTYVRTTLQAELRQPIWGWWGRRDMFDMEHGYEPVDGIRSWRTGTPSVLSMAAIEPGVAMIVEAGVDAIRVKSVALTELAIDAFDALLAPLGFSLQSPRDSARRGGHVTVVHPDAARLCRELIERDVIPDFRRPDGIRIGLAPLSTSFTDVVLGLEMLARLAGSGPRNG
jgi:kynureninase